MLARARAAAGGVGELGCWLLRRRARYRVAGRSMEPTLSRGDQVLINPSGRPRPGDLVVAVHPAQDQVLVVKRVAEILADGSLVLASDNPGEGSDSRTWGPLPRSRVRGRVTVGLDRPFAGPVSVRSAP